MKKRRRVKPVRKGPVVRVMVNFNASQMMAVRQRALHDTRTLSSWIRNLVLLELAK